jgi:hypothetical protein|eukprot:COSAG01_NODE_5546_length_4192_cov_2.172978_6_plen_329_part_00
MEQDPLPRWWLAAISLYCIPCAMSSCLFVPIVQPPLIATIVGEARKHQFLGMLSALQSGVHLIDPFLGSLSDNARCAFRRRGLVVYGGLAPAAGLFLTMLALRLRDIHTLVVSLALYYSGMAYGWLPYMTVLPELVPTSQRGLAAGFMSLSAGVGGFSGNLLGIAIGQHVLPTSSAVWFLEGIMLLGIALGCLALSDRPGLCRPERLPPQPDQQDDQESHRPLVTGDDDGGASRRLRGLVGSFFSALDEPAYRAYVIYAFSTSCSPWGVFMFYFFDDQIAPHGFYVMGHRITHSTQSAMALVALITQIMNLFFPLCGGWLGDRMVRVL